MGLISARRFQVTHTPLVQNNDAYDANDVVADSKSIGTNVVLSMHGGPVKLEQIEFWDTNDQTAAALTFVFLNALKVYGALDAAPSISDADSLFLTGQYVAAAANILDHGGVKYGLWNPNIILQPSDQGDLYMAIASAGTPTYLTGCLTVRLSFTTV